MSIDLALSKKCHRRHQQLKKRWRVAVRFEGGKAQSVHSIRSDAIRPTRQVRGFTREEIMEVRQEFLQRYNLESASARPLASLFHRACAALRILFRP